MARFKGRSVDSAAPALSDASCVPTLGDWSGAEALAPTAGPEYERLLVDDAAAVSSGGSASVQPIQSAFQRSATPPFSSLTPLSSSSSSSSSNSSSNNSSSNIIASTALLVPATTASVSGLTMDISQPLLDPSPHTIHHPSYSATAGGPHNALSRSQPAVAAAAASDRAQSAVDALSMPKGAVVAIYADHGACPDGEQGEIQLQLTMLAWRHVRCNTM
jgi:hypothetical protein